MAVVRQAADASCTRPMLSLEEKALLTDKYAKKRVDSQKRGIAVMLRDIMGHKVGSLMISRRGFGAAISCVAVLLQ